MTITFDNSYARDLPGTYLRLAPDAAPAPRLLAWNAPLAASLGLTLDESDAASWFSGATLPPGADPIAQAYAGHQFGGFSPQLGDGRAHLLGEILAPDGRRFDLQLKGSGRTPFSRGGDGKAAIGPMLREYLISEAMAALGVPNHPVACRRGHGRGDLARNQTPRCGPDPRRLQPSARRHVPVLRRPGRQGATQGAGRLYHRPARPGAGDRQTSPTSPFSMPSSAGRPS